MYPASFEYHAPGTVKEALTLLGKLDDAKILAGGHSLVPMMKLRLAQPKHVIDLRKVSGLSGIKEDKGAFAIGANGENGNSRCGNESRRIHASAGSPAPTGNSCPPDLPAAD